MAHGLTQMEIYFANGMRVDCQGAAANEGALSFQQQSSPQASQAISSCLGIDFNDRALQYGDGVFETMRIFNGQIPMWEFHQQRLLAAQQALGLPIDEFLQQWDEFQSKHLSSIDNACIKLLISRGIGPRGYAAPKDIKLNWWLKIMALPESVTDSVAGTAANKLYNVTLCQHALSRQPALAGLKHLNRLDQVVARSEWGAQQGFDEGIMFNIDGDIIEGTMSNIFWLKDGQLNTPDLSQEGVDGCVRRWLIKHYSDALTVNIVKDAKLDQLLTADGVFLTNSLIGIQKVGYIDGQSIAQCDQVDDLAKAFNQQYV